MGIWGSSQRKEYGKFVRSRDVFFSLLLSYPWAQVLLVGGLKRGRLLLLRMLCGRLLWKLLLLRWSRSQFAKILRLDF